ncbi:MAG TPA: DUF547 domain-containing protein [Gammaproteobacteria bacterium]
MIRNKHLASAAAALLLVGIATLAAAAPRAELWERWSAHDPDSAQRIDHRPRNEILSRFVVPASDGINRFAYSRVGAADRQLLRDYLQAMSRVEIGSYRRDEQRAFWINLYNALTVEVILEHYPLATIRDISSGFFSRGPWDLELIEIDNQALTLNDIEHRILRPIWQDPRIHYAVNCASLGCPNLQRQAFTAANSDSLLEVAAVEFVNHPRGARVVDGELLVSSIYDWFEADFGGNEAGVIAHLRRYAKAELRAALAGIDDIADDNYDWSINSLQPPR